MMPLSMIKNKSKESSVFAKKAEQGFTLLDVMIGMVVITAAGGIAVMTISGVTHANNTQELASAVTSVNNDYDYWLGQNPNATTEQKQAHIRETVSALNNSKFIGAAYESGKSEDICLWSSLSNNSNISKGMTITAIGKETNCSAMETVLTGNSRTNRTTNQDPPVVNAAPATPAPEFPWSILLGVAASGAVVGTGGFVTYKSVGKVKEAKKRSDAEKKLRLKNRNDWAALLERHDVIRREWSLYELDAMKMLDFPMLSDMREPVTVKLHTALRDANNVRPANAEAMIDENAKGSDYEKAVSALEIAFHVAQTEAKRVQWHKYSVAEQKRLSTAKNLLSFVMDGAASEFERQAAYKRLQKEISGLITLPKMTMNVLEDKMRVMITA